MNGVSALLLIILPVAIGALLAMVSNAFAYRLSRYAEAAFDFIELKLALKAHRRAARSAPKRTARRASYSHAG